MAMNYFKEIEEIEADFRKLNLMQMQSEIGLLLEKYISFGRSDIKLIGKNTSKTENIWHLYKRLKDIFMKLLEEKVKDLPKSQSL
jgi:hypothetical protein